MFISRGQKATAIKYIYRAMQMLKVNHGRTPLLMVFEILEGFRLPFRVAPSRRGGGKGYNRVFLLSWWKQYSQVMKWFRSSCKRGTVSALISWDKQLLMEFELLVTNSPASRLYKRRMSVLQLAAAGRIYSHYRWGNRTMNKFAARGVRDLFVKDQALAGTTNAYIRGLEDARLVWEQKDQREVREWRESKRGFAIANTWDRDARRVARRKGHTMWEKDRPEPIRMSRKARKKLRALILK